MSREPSSEGLGNLRSMLEELTAFCDKHDGLVQSIYATAEEHSCLRPCYGECSSRLAEAELENELLKLDEEIVQELTGWFEAGETVWLS